MVQLGDPTSPMGVGTGRDIGVLAPRDMPPIPDLGHLAPVFLTLHIVGGQIILPILVATCAWSKSVIRHPTLINFLSTWIIHSVCSCLLLYSKEPIHTSPAGPICFAQSALTHGTLTMCASSGLMVVIQAWSMFHQPELGSNRWLFSPGLVAKLAFPYIVFVVYTVTTAILQHYHPEDVKAPNGLYCSLYKDPFRRYAVTMYCVASLGLVILIELAIAIRYYYTWRQIATVFPLANRNTSTSLVVRLTLFNIYSFVALSAGICFATNRSVQWPYLVQASLPLGVALVFGSQKDFLRAWCFWKKKQKPGEVADEGMHRCRKIDSIEDLLKRTPSPQPPVPSSSIVGHDHSPANTDTSVV
ncbi:hypothetical protein BKA70DRAFT_1417760 [Coprinopsis sp. MPI-PUGE-AT-0042]|nr:hypothetical protein BKA70DRAFT_1417760 [Coprinopsis sp. MPI-PUGE-AT-0042]